MKTILYDNRDDQSKRNLYNELKQLPENEYCIVIKKNRPIRSLSANKYYHFILNYICAATNTGLSHDGLHNLCKEKFNYEIIDLPKSGSILIGKSTKDLDSAEFANYISKVKVWCFEEFGITIPDVKDVDYQKWYEVDNAYTKMFSGF